MPPLAHFPGRNQCAPHKSERNHHRAICTRGQGTLGVIRERRGNAASGWIFIEISLNLVPQHPAPFMGRTYLFECFRCGYRAWVSGGAGAGEHFAVQTVSCADCKELYDAVTEFKAAASLVAGGGNKIAPGFAVALNRLPPRGARPRLSFKAACPVSPLHHVRAWNRPDKCPKCGTFMEQNGLPFRLWD